ncbi:MAG: C40 family peptidase [Ignavibacteria bacterium]|nr:C40 family peptidase [Ignavibacteria bacterium]MCU7501691.1 C40 family peptidase [Ignavibacteria bacterium]MCU7516902.1 C40 family peptidase [Ignavibacteria bacterium]
MLLTGFLIGTLTLTSAAENKKMTELLDKIKQQFAPDKRTAIFNVQAEEEKGTVTLKGETNLQEAKDKLISEVKKNGINVKDEISLLPSKDLNGKTYGVINLSVANIRTHHEHSAEMATQGLLGTPVKVLKKENGWFLIQTPDQYIAWVDGDGVQQMTKDEYNDWNESAKVIYTAFYGFTFADPDLNSAHVSDIVKGNILKVVGEAIGFVKVQYPDNRLAYIPKGECMDFEQWLDNREITAENMIKTGKTLMGIPYLWGGTSVKGLDCSGFTKTIYYLNGVILPRDASQQVYSGDPVDTKDSFDNLKPGDLLFFGTKATATTKEKATHVAMYIGNGEYIHSSGRVRINSLDMSKKNFNSHRYDTFLRARRILTSLDKNGIALIKSNNLKLKVENETK